MGQSTEAAQRDGMLMRVCECMPQITISKALNNYLFIIFILTILFLLISGLN